MNCKFEQAKPGVFVCPKCNQTPIETEFAADKIRRTCKIVPVQAGVGMELTRLLHRVGIYHRPGCKCRKRAAMMNRKGIEWCRENIDKILGWLEEEATARGLPFVRIIGRQIIWLAVRRATRRNSQLAQT